MKLLSLVLLAIALILGTYCLFYEKEVQKAKHRMGFTIPRNVEHLLRINVYLSIAVSIILGIFLLL